MKMVGGDTALGQQSSRSTSCIWWEWGV